MQDAYYGKIHRSYRNKYSHVKVYAMNKAFAFAVTLGVALTVVPPVLAWSWTVETVHNPTATVGKYTSLKVDTSGNPHISYYDETNGNLLYARKTSTGWVREIVDYGQRYGANVGLWTSLALDASGNPHISYWDITNGKVKHAWKGPRFVSWAIETVASTPYGGSWTSLVLDASGYPHLSYYDGKLKYARKTSTGWVVETVENLFGPGEYPSLALDASGNPHIAYADGDRLKYAKKSGTWSIQTVDTAGEVIRDVSLALDDDGKPHIAYLRISAYTTYGYEDLYYTRRISGDWDRDWIHSSALGEISLALNASGNPHISYYDYADDRLHYARKSGTSWVEETPDAWAVYFGLDHGRYSSIALDDNGKPHISYFDETVGSLRYAKGS